jgi:DNA-binding transcriptional MerR regulator
MMSEANTFTISTLSTLTGVHTRTLRSWELRYGLLKPARTEKGFRLYQHADVDKVNAILSYIKRGVAVGKVKNLLSLKAFESDAVAASIGSKWPDYLEAFIASAKSFNSNKLDQLYNEIISLYPIEVISTRLFLPLLKTYQAYVLANYQGAIAEEHFLATYVRNRLAAHFQQLASITKGAKLVFASLPSERHDYVLLLFGIHCMTAGFKVISLGANNTLEQTLFAAKQSGAAAIVAVGCLSTQDKKMIEKSPIQIFNYHHGQTKSDISLPEDFSQALHVLKQTIKITGVEHG